MGVFTLKTQQAAAGFIHSLVPRSYLRAKISLGSFFNVAIKLRRDEHFIERMNPWLKCHWSYHRYMTRNSYCLLGRLITMDRDGYRSAWLVGS